LPELGKVKTRLALTTSNSFATHFYNATAKHIFKELNKNHSEKEVFAYYSQVDDINKIKKWVGIDFNFQVQKGETLGKKMSNAFGDLFDKGYKKVLIIGSDIPDITNNILIGGFDSLEKNDVVISPADDGGYSMLGMKSYYPELFENIEWSTNSVLLETKNRIKQRKLKLEILDTLPDIDTEEELLNWMKSSKNKKLVDEIRILVKKEKIKI